MFLINPTVALIVIQDAVSGFTKRIRVGISVWHFFCASLEWFSIIYSLRYFNVIVSESKTSLSESEVGTTVTRNMSKCCDSRNDDIVV